MLPRFIPEPQLEAQVTALLERGCAQGMTLEGAVDVEYLAEAVLELTVLYDDTLPMGLLGMADHARRHIRLNARESNLGRVRFTLAHELGHFVLHIPLLEIQTRQTALFEEQNIAALLRSHHVERQADMFAAALLLPKAALLSFGQRCLDRGLNAFQQLDAVCEHFQTSKQATRIRLERLGLVPGSQQALLGDGL